MMSRCILLMSLPLLPLSLAVRCFDCVGTHCSENSCEGDYCVLAYYSPRLGSRLLGDHRVVRGCMSGQMLAKEIKDHCDVSKEDEKDSSVEVYNCICSSEDYCNGGWKLSELESVPTKLVQCECKGAHCNGQSTCAGDMCSYVVNHKTRRVEKGCVNASVPLVERRSSGSCMMPPLTGAMYHHVPKNAEDLLSTESCVCATDYCNAAKPMADTEVSIARHRQTKESVRCPAFVSMSYNNRCSTQSRNLTCSGQYCFQASIKSKMSKLREFTTMGCASFDASAILTPEMRPAGCATFESEQLRVEVCYEMAHEQTAEMSPSGSRSDGEHYSHETL